MKDVRSPAALPLGEIGFALCLVLNTASAQTTSYTIGPLEIFVHTKTSSVAAHPSVIANARSGEVVFGGGAQVGTNSNGNLLTTSGPLDALRYQAESRDHFIVSPADITAYAISARQKDGGSLASDYIRITKTSPLGENVSAAAWLPTGYTLVGGGALVKNPQFSTASFIWKSIPAVGGWEAAAKSHRRSNVTSITAVAIGIRTTRLEALGLRVRQYDASTTTRVSQPSMSVSVPPGWVVIGGGAATDWVSPRAGSLLTNSYPTSSQTWFASARDHIDPDPSLLVVRVIGMTIQASSTKFGSSCGPALPELDAGSPTPGLSFSITGSKSPITQGYQSFLLLGLPGPPTPLFGCTFQFDFAFPPILVRTAPSTSSNWSTSLQIPNNTSYLGLMLNLENLYVGPSLPVQKTNAVRVRVGY